MYNNVQLLNNYILIKQNIEFKLLLEYILDLYVVIFSCLFIHPPYSKFYIPAPPSFIGH